MSRPPRSGSGPGPHDDGDETGPLSYESARAELAEVMRSLEAGGQSLEESLELWRRGEILADVCQGWLDRAAADLDRAISERSSGESREKRAPADDD